MLKLDKKPATILESIDRYLFIMANSNVSTSRGEENLIRPLKDFANTFGYVKLTDTDGLKFALNKFFDIKGGNIRLHNERVFGITNFFGWMLDKGYVHQDFSRNYMYVQ